MGSTSEHSTFSVFAVLDNWATILHKYDTQMFIKKNYLKNGNWTPESSISMGLSQKL